MASRNGHSNGSAVRRLDPFVDPIALNKLTAAVQNLTADSRQWSRDLLDPRRSIDDECGYPPGDAPVSSEVYRQLFSRDAISNRVMTVMARESWQVNPEVHEDDDPETETAFERAFADLAKTLASNGGESWHQDEEGSIVWHHLRRLDELSGIGHFGCMLFGFDDEADLSIPLDEVMVANGARIDSPATDDEIRLLKNPVEHVYWSPFAKPVRNADGSITRNSKTPGIVLNERQVIIVNAWEQRSIAHKQFVRNEIERSLRPSTGASTSKGPYNPTEANPVHPNASYMQGMMGTEAQYWNPQGQGLIGSPQAQYFGVQGGPDTGAEPGKDGKPQKRQRKLLFLRCYDESLIQIVRYEWNIRSPRFGMPVMYRITLNDPRMAHSGVGLPLATVFVHWTRVLHAADNLAASEFSAIPRAEPVLNRLLDLRKVYGADGEASWRNAFLKLFFETHPQLGGDVIVNKTAMRDDIENMMNGLQQWMLTTGMSAKAIPPALSDPTPHAAVQIEAICIQLGIPKRVFMGSERGELASSQDDSSWNDRLRARQNQYITPRIIAPFIDRLIQAGVLPAPENASLPDVMPPQPPRTGPKVEAPAAGGKGGPPGAGGPAGKMTSPPGGPPGGPAGGAPKPPGGGPGGAKPPAGPPGGVAKPPMLAPSPVAAPTAGPKGGFPPATNALPFGQDEEPTDEEPADEPADDLEQPEPDAEQDDADALQPDAAGQPLGAAPALPGQEGKSDNVRRGYSIKWPDLDSLTDKDKAAIALQRTQAYSAYIAGNVEQLLPPKAFMTLIDGMDDEQVDAILIAAEQANMADELKQQQMIDEHGFEPLPPEGFHDPEHPTPTALNPGQSLHDPETGEELAASPHKPPQPIAQINPAQPPSGPAPPQGAPGQNPQGGPFDGQPPPGKPGQGAVADFRDQKPRRPGQQPPVKNAWTDEQIDAEIDAVWNQLLETGLDGYEVNKFCPTGQGGGVDPTCGADSKGEGTKERPVRCGADIHCAAKALAEGKHIQLNQPEQVSTLMDKMHAMVQEAVAKGEDAPKYDLCKVSVPGTNLFCAETVGIPRAQMPQMRGTPVEGSHAATLPRNKEGKVDIGKEFVQHIKDLGIEVEETSVRASNLRASQNEIDGARVAGLVKTRSIDDLRKRPIFVTSDNYVIDGHHHWAAIVGHGAAKDKDYKVPVYRMDMGIGEAISRANSFAKEKGIKPKSVPSATKNRAEPFSWHWDPVSNKFCATGASGGVDPTCGKDDAGHGGGHGDAGGHGEHGAGGHEHGPEHELEHAGHEYHDIHEAEHAAHAIGHHPGDVLAIATSRVLPYATKAVAAALKATPGLAKAGQAVSDLHEGAAKLVESAVSKMEARYGKATAAAILGAGNVVAGMASSGAALAIPKRNLIGALPLMALAETGRALGVIGPGSKVEAGLRRVGGWVQAIKSGVANLGLKGFRTAGKLTGKVGRALGVMNFADLDMILNMNPSRFANPSHDDHVMLSDAQLKMAWESFWDQIQEKYQATVDEQEQAGNLDDVDQLLAASKDDPTEDDQPQTEEE